MIEPGRPFKIPEANDRAVKGGPNPEQRLRRSSDACRVRLSTERDSHTREYLAFASAPFSVDANTSFPKNVSSSLNNSLPVTMGDGNIAQSRTFLHREQKLKPIHVRHNGIDEGRVNRLVFKSSQRLLSVL